MNRSLSVLLAAALATGGVAAVVTVAGAPAGAAGRTCTAWATLPARVALTSTRTVIRPQLRGTSGCRADTFDGGATAQLRARGAASYDQRWVHFGDRERIELHPSLDHTGRYAIRDGHAQVYDANEVRVPSTWRDTVTTVKFGARFVAVAASRSGAHATLKHYDVDGWRPSARTAVVLQKRTSDGWTTVARTRTGDHGVVRFARTLHGQYRLASAQSATVWNTAAGLGNRV